MIINYAELKTAMRAAGYQVSAGDGWTAADTTAYTAYAALAWNKFPKSIALAAQQYTDLAPEDFPGAGGTPPAERTLLSISIQGISGAMVGGVSALKAIGTYNVAPLTQDLTSTAEWESSQPSTASIVDGIVSGVATGTASITATVGEVTGTMSFTVHVPATPTEPVAEPNQPPVEEALKEDGTLVVGEGIPSTYSNNAEDGVVQLFVTPLIAAVSAQGPGVDGVYEIELAEGQDAGFAFGATMVNPADGAQPLTDAADVTMKIAIGEDSCLFNLVAAPDTPQKYNWASVEQPSYVITDSATNDIGSTSQNVTRFKFLQEAGLLPADVGTFTVTLTATNTAYPESTPLVLETTMNVTRA